MSEELFMEHPAAEHATAIDAMEDALCRLRALPKWERWITFCAQGEGTSPESIHLAEVRLLRDTLDVAGPVDVSEIARLAKVKACCFAVAGQNYSIAAATPREAAQILDAIFRHHLGTHPFADEDEDYAVGAEW